MLALAAVTALGSAAIHMLVPALPALSAELAVSAQAAQYTISLYLFGLAAGQLLGGPIADRAGRRPILVVGMGLYIAGAVIGAVAEGLVLLCAARILQALGAGAGLVGARVVVADLYGRRDAGRGQARLMGVVLASTALAPALGGFISGAWGWRPVLGLQGVLAIAACAVIWRALPETGRLATPGRVAVERPYLRLLRNGSFKRTALGVALCSSSLYVYLAISPFVLIDQWGETASAVGLYFAWTAIAAIVGTLLVGRLEKRFDAFRLGIGVSFAGTVITLIAALLALEHWAALMLPAMIVTFGVGIAGPAGAALVLHCEEGLAGTASSLAGALQMAGGGLAASVVAWLFAPTFLVLALVMVLLVGAAWLLAPRK